MASLSAYFLSTVFGFCLLLLGLATAAQAGNSGSGIGPTNHVLCECMDNFDDSFEFCAEDPCGLDCSVGGQAFCDANDNGTICNDPSNGCGFSNCVTVCTDEGQNCGNLHTFMGFPGEDFPPCPASLAAPALSQWGLILVGLLLMAMIAWTVRRGQLSHHMTAGLLVLMSAGLIATSVSYAEIQADRTCGETDVAVEFVRNLLEG